MYIALNRFKVKLAWNTSLSKCGEIANPILMGYQDSKNLTFIKKALSKRTTTYASHSLWESEELFIAWTRSENFRQAHKNAKITEFLFSHPIFEGFEIVI